MPASDVFPAKTSFACRVQGAGPAHPDGESAPDRQRAVGDAAAEGVARVEQPGAQAARVAAAVSGKRRLVVVRHRRCPTSGTVTAAGSTPRTTRSSRSRARATRSFATPKGAATAISACASAATAIAGAVVGASSRVGEPAEHLGRPGVGAGSSELGLGGQPDARQRVHPGQCLERRPREHGDEGQQPGVQPYRRPGEHRLLHPRVRRPGAGAARELRRRHGPPQQGLGGHRRRRTAQTSVAEQGVDAVACCRQGGRDAFQPRGGTEHVIGSRSHRASVGRRRGEQVD